jgi:catechol 1,2-dioxygenase
VNGEFTLIDFDFTLFKERDNVQGTEVERPRAAA